MLEATFVFAALLSSGLSLILVPAAFVYAFTRVRAWNRARIERRAKFEADFKRLTEGK
jgi:hypothetical protein